MRSSEAQLYFQCVLLVGLSNLKFELISVMNPDVSEVFWPLGPYIKKNHGMFFKSVVVAIIVSQVLAPRWVKRSEWQKPPLMRDLLYLKNLTSTKAIECHTIQANSSSVEIYMSATYLELNDFFSQYILRSSHHQCIRWSLWSQKHLKSTWW